MRRESRFLLLLSCFLLSGLAGLIYQTAWTQQLALVFGTSDLAVATVLAAYMAGLALGAAAAGRWQDRVRRPVLAYALLELGIAVAALAIPAALEGVKRLQVALLGGGTIPVEAGSLGAALFYLVGSLLVLLVPTALMGATLPLLARHAVRTDAEIGPRIGALYTANTAGAALGTLAAAFLLLPLFGLGRTVLVAAGVNGLVFLLAAALARHAPLPPSAAAEGAVEPGAVVTPSRPAAGRYVLPLILLSGVVSFSYEVLWTRLLTHLLGGSVYAFGTMLATFLVGIALGAAAAARLARSPALARRGFVAAQLAIAATGWGAFALLDRLPALLQRLDTATVHPLLTGAALSAATLLPGALAIGATFPFAVRILAREATDAAPASARVFAWNTAGAILGAVGTGFLLLPLIRFAGTAAVAIGLSLVIAALAALLPRPRWRLAAALAAVGLVLLALRPPATPWAVIRHAPLGSGPASYGDVVYYGVGRGATVLMVERAGEWRLTTNGLPESTIQPPWARPGRYLVARWLSMLPIAARPTLRSLLVVGLGAGITLEEIPPSVEQIHVIELEPEVVRANREVAAERRKDPLADPRLTLHVGDARGALQLAGQRFDAIVSQPSHPWTAGASHLFTRELFALVRDHLNPQGVFVQWVGVHFVDGPLMRSLLATLLDVFPHVEVYRPAGRSGVLFLASPAPLDLAESAPRALAAAPAFWRMLGIYTLEDVLATRHLDTAGGRQLAAGAPLITDAHNLLQTRAPGLMHRAHPDREIDTLLGPYDPLLTPQPGLDMLYLVRRLSRDGNFEQARRTAFSLRDPGMRQAALGLVMLAANRPRPAAQSLQQAVARGIEHREVRAALLLLRRPALMRGEAEAPATLVSDEVEAAVVAGWQALANDDGAALEALDDALAAAQPQHPLFEACVHLRIAWRLGRGTPALASEALTLLDPLLSDGAVPRDLLLRARIAAVAGAHRACLASLDELAVKLGRLPRAQQLATRARTVLDSLPADPTTVAWRQRIAEQLQRAHQ